MRKIEFISYDGKYPNLCSGNLVLNVDGEEYCFKGCLVSGGSAGVDFSGNSREEYCTIGKWSLLWIGKDGKFNLNFYCKNNNLTFTKEEIDYITDLVNENVPQGCCGGCI